MARFLFVGEKPSATAEAKGWQWKDGRLAAKPLFEALREAGIDPDSCDFLNLFGDTAAAPERPDPGRVASIKASAAAGQPVVALGAKVARQLGRASIPHRQLVHPAARGAIRGRGRYRAHVLQVLG
jgi:hypothetical protein